MYISQCLITKNEENNIEYCLSHLKSVVNEQIVVDTGSTDRTVEIAESLGAKVFHFDWINDFSAARNFALDKAKGDWILFLDCDEYFSEDSITSIKEIIKSTSRFKDVDGIMCELINIDQNKNVLSTMSNISPRIFKNKDYLRFNNKIHEILTNKYNVESKVSLLNASKILKLFHTGYDKKEVLLKNKNERNILLLQKELEESPQNAKLNLYYSKQLRSEEKYNEALDYCLKSYNYMDNSIFNDYYYEIYSNIMINMIALSMPYEDIKTIYEEAICKYSDYPDYYMYMGKACLKNNKVLEAVGYLEKCIYYCEHYSNKIESNALGNLVNIYNNLLDLYTLMDNRKKIVELSITMLKINKYNLEVLSLLLKTFLTQEKEKDVIVFLSKIYDYNNFKDKIYLIKSSELLKNEILIEFYNSLLNEEELLAVNNSKL
jgi:glycosyltransferase involved in cell wall biosynthesis